MGELNSGTIIVIIIIIIIILIVIAMISYQLYSTYKNAIALQLKSEQLASKANDEATKLAATSDAIIALAARTSSFENKVPTTLQLCQLAKAQADICSTMPPPVPPCPPGLLLKLVGFTFSQICVDAGYKP